MWQGNDLGSRRLCCRPVVSQHIFNHAVVGSTSGKTLQFTVHRFHVFSNSSGRMFMQVHNLAFKYFPSSLNMIIRDKSQMPLSVFSSILSQRYADCFLSFQQHSCPFCIFPYLPWKNVQIIFARIPCQLFPVGTLSRIATHTSFGRREGKSHSFLLWQWQTDV